MNDSEKLQARSDQRKTVSKKTLSKRRLAIDLTQGTTSNMREAGTWIPKSAAQPENEVHRKVESRRRSLGGSEG
jgi:hypothetical protein